MKRGRNDADTCRLNDWAVGDRLIGEPTPYERTPVIRITAIGETRILAIEDNAHGETVWTLSLRVWRKVDPT